jgi:hypothetical protein
LRKAVEGLLGLQPGEPRANAEVRAVAKGEVGCSGTGEVQPVRVWIARGVAVRGTQHYERLLSREHCGSVEDEIGQRDTGSNLNRAVIAQQLLDDLRRELGMPREPVELVGVLE